MRTVDSQAGRATTNKWESRFSDLMASIDGLDIEQTATHLLTEWAGIRDQLLSGGGTGPAWYAAW